LIQEGTLARNIDSKSATPGFDSCVCAARCRLNQHNLPLSEESELYQLEILDGLGGNVLRAVTGLGEQAYLYTAADQTTDFGLPQWNVAIRVSQISVRYGAGATAEQLTYDYQH
jgi:hypothetical protein